MSRETADAVLALLDRSPDVEELDLTGGAPELNEQFRPLVRGAVRLGKRVIDRCNLTVLLLPGQEDTAAFLAEHRVRIVASLPCHGPENVDAQRGRGVFERSIEALRRLNAQGYAEPGSGRILDLVFNPQDTSLPPDPARLEAEYRERLGREHGLRFDRLLTLTNMPIRRFARRLEREGRLEDYLAQLAGAMNPETVDRVMCRSLVSVSWDGRLHDCDFNQMLEMPLPGPVQHLVDGPDLGRLAGEPIATASHCFGCTAGAGSSCGGALA